LSRNTLLADLLVQLHLKPFFFASDTLLHLYPIHVCMKFLDICHCSSGRRGVWEFSG
jgi:hypothetical protein